MDRGLVSNFTKRKSSKFNEAIIERRLCNYANLAVKSLTLLIFSSPKCYFLTRICPSAQFCDDCGVEMILKCVRGMSSFLQARSMTKLANWWRQQLW